MKRLVMLLAALFLLGCGNSEVPLTLEHTRLTAKSQNLGLAGVKANPKSYLGKTIEIEGTLSRAKQPIIPNQLDVRDSKGTEWITSIDGMSVNQNKELYFRLLNGEPARIQGIVSRFGDTYYLEINQALPLRTLTRMVSPGVPSAI